MRKSKKRSSLRAALATLALILATASLATAEEVQKEGLLVATTASMRPTRLPRKGAVPIAVSVGWGVSTADGSTPPNLRKLAVEINRNGRFDFAGLPVCKIAQIQPGSSGHALSVCRRALVGRGDFKATIALHGQVPYRTQGRLLVFNGRQGGRPALFGHIYAAHPFATSFVIVFAVRGIAHGTYGTVLSAKLPAALLSWGHLTAIDMRLFRRFAYRGAARSFISAGCPAPKGFPGATFPLARTTFSFVGRRSVTQTLTRECRARG